MSRTVWPASCRRISGILPEGFAHWGASRKGKNDGSFAGRPPPFRSTHLTRRSGCSSAEPYPPVRCSHFRRVTLQPQVSIQFLVNLSAVVIVLAPASGLARRESRASVPQDDPLASHNRSHYEDALRCTTQRQTEQKTELKIHYQFHPWGGETVQLVKRINGGSGPICRVERMISGKLRRIDIPSWMFDRATCAAMVAQEEPLVCFQHLAQLRRLLASVSNLPNGNVVENELTSIPSKENAHEDKDQTESPTRTA